MPYCENCGAVLDRSLARCPLCGTKVTRMGNEPREADNDDSGRIGKNASASPYADGYRGSAYERSSLSNKSPKDEDLSLQKQEQNYAVPEDDFADDGFDDGIKDDSNGPYGYAGGNNPDNGQRDVNEYGYWDPEEARAVFEHALKLYGADPELPKHLRLLSVLKALLSIDCLLLIFFLKAFFVAHIFVVIFGTYVSIQVKKTAKKYGLGWWPGNSCFAVQACFMAVTAVLMHKIITLGDLRVFESDNGFVYFLIILANALFMPAIAYNSMSWTFKISKELEKLKDGGYREQVPIDGKSIFKMGASDLVICLFIILMAVLGNWLVHGSGLFR